MVIDFKEIPAANSSDGNQDQFELFAREFLEHNGFSIIHQPSRGADGKMDLIVTERRGGIIGETTVRWLVSCKHFAHSGKSVSDIHEPDISDRVKKHKCNGFLGFYSTLPSTSLAQKLKSLDDILVFVFDRELIERKILEHKNAEVILFRFFPNSSMEYRKGLIGNTIASRNNNSGFITGITTDDLLAACKSAMIILEIEKLKREVNATDWKMTSEVLNKFYWFQHHSNENVAAELLAVLSDVASATRIKMPWEVASTIQSLILTFFPSSNGEDEERARIENGIQCVHIGSNIVYDALIYLGDFHIAGYGFLIMKYVSRYARRKNCHDLSDMVLHEYKELHQTLARPERTDLENAKQLVQIFEEDLTTEQLAFPPLPEHLLKLFNPEWNL